MNWFKRKELPVSNETPALPVEALSTRLEEVWSDADAEAELDRMEEEDKAAPFAAMIEHLRQLGFSGDQIVHCVRLVELNRAAAIASVTPSQAVTRKSRPKKRSRAKYMRDYRKGLRVVTGGASQKHTERG